MQKKTINISVPQAMAEYIEHEVQSGEYASTSDFFRTLIREHQAGRGRTGDDLRAMIRDGLESGESTPLNMAAVIEKAQARLNG